MTKTIITGLVAMIACTLMACGSAGGPSESDPTDTASTNSSEKAATYYTCSHTRFPCSDSELQAIKSSKSYNASTGHFLSSTNDDCQICGDSSCDLN